MEHMALMDGGRRNLLLSHRPGGRLWRRRSSCFEETVEWPDDLAQAIVPLITEEGGGPKLDQQRPITIRPVLYKAWAGMRYDDLKNCQEQGSEGCIIGGMQDVKAVRAALETALNVDEVRLEDQALTAAFLDYSKYFDQLPWQ